MPNPMMDALRAAAAQPQGGIVRVPSQTEIDEVHRVQGLQVRTNAAQMATNLLTAELGQPITVKGANDSWNVSLGHQPKAIISDWYVLARAIEMYILGVNCEDAVAPRVPPGQEA